MNPTIYDIALKAGGSHYPQVGGKLLETAILMAVGECMAIALDNDDIHTAEMIATKFGLDK